MGWLADYSYRKLITLKRVSGAVSNYQMKLNVGESAGASGEDVDCNSHCQPDFDDIRFTKSDGTTLLDYWIESITGSTPNQLATIWIEFDSIGTDDTTFYMYYGNSSAAAYSNGTDTFQFFDDFSGDLGKWTTLLGTPSISSGRLLLDASEKIRSNNKYGATCAISMKVQLSSTDKTAQCGLSDSTGVSNLNSNCNSAAFFWPYYGHKLCTLYTESYSTTTEEKTDGTYNTDEHKYDILVLSASSVKFYKDGVLVNTHTTQKPDDPMYAECFNYNINFSSVYIDNVYVRNYIDTEPTWGSWGEEEEVTLKYLYLKDGMITQEVVAGKKLSLNNNQLYASANPAKPLILDNGYIKEYS